MLLHLHRLAEMMFNQSHVFCTIMACLWLPEGTLSPSEFLLGGKPARARGQICPSSAASLALPMFDPMSNELTDMPSSKVMM